MTFAAGDGGRARNTDKHLMERPIERTFEGGHRTRALWRDRFALEMESPSLQLIAGFACTSEH